MLVSLALPVLAHTPSEPPHQNFSFGDLKLESGEAIKDFAVSYVTHGTLNASKSNAILMVTSIGGNHHRIDYLIGPGRALDLKTSLGATVEELAAWISNGPERGGLAAYLNANELDPPPRFRYITGSNNPD